MFKSPLPKVREFVAKPLAGVLLRLERATTVVLARLNVPGAQQSQNARNILRAFGIVLLIAIALQAVSLGKFGKAVERETSLRMLFIARSALGLDPALDPRIKIFSYDDRTAAFLKSLDMPAEDWVRSLNAIAAREPKLIIVDKLFDRTYSEQEIATFKDGAAARTTPTILISFVHPDEIPFREPLDLNLFPERLVEDSGEPPRWLDTSPGKIYGVSRALAPAFTATGHSLYDDDGLSRAVHRLGSGEILTQISLAAGGKVTLDRRGIRLGDQRVPLGSDGKILVNFAPRRVYAKRAFSMLAVIERARRGLDIPVVNKGDVVVVLPGMYTGNTDWRETPFGSMSGGYYVVAMANSALTGTWISRLEDPGFFVLLAAIFAMAVGLAFPPTKLLKTLGIGLVLTIAGTLGLFLTVGLAAQPTIPVIGALLASAFAWSSRSRAEQLEQLRMAKELETAELVQHAFLPGADLVDGAGIRCVGWFKPASECGGDWWGHFVWDKRIDFVLIGDAIGHGVPAALVTAIAFTVKSIFASAPTEPDPQHLLREIDRILLAMNSNLACMTFQLLRIERETGRMRVLNAGHTLPTRVPRAADDSRLKPGQRTKVIISRGTLLGQGGEFSAGEKEEELKPGDRVVIYTDGIVENHNQKGKSLGRNAIVETLASNAEKGTAELRDALVIRYLMHTASTPADDDATLVVIEYRPEEKSAPEIVAAPPGIEP